MEKIIGAVIICLGGVGLVVGISTFMAFPIMWCWNYVMPYLFEFKCVTWGQAWCLSFLCGYLIKSSNTNNNKE